MWDSRVTKGITMTTEEEFLQQINDEDDDAYSVTEHEHIEWDEKGDVAGVHTIDVKEVDGVDKWDKIEKIITEYVKLHPNYMRLFLHENKKERQRQANKYASTEDRQLRYGIAIPPGLMYTLQEFEPNLFNNDTLRHTFMKKFKGFTICDVV